MLIGTRRPLRVILCSAAGARPQETAFAKRSALISLKYVPSLLTASRYPGRLRKCVRR